MSIIVGATCGAVILALVVALVWYFMRRRKSEGEYADLINAEAKPPDLPPAGHGPTSGGPGWSTHCDQSHSGLALAPQLNERVSRTVAPRDFKRQPLGVQRRGVMAGMTEGEIEVSRMRVQDPPQ